MGSELATRAGTLDIARLRHQASSRVRFKSPCCAPRTSHLAPRTLPVCSSRPLPVCSFRRATLRVQGFRVHPARGRTVRLLRDASSRVTSLSGQTLGTHSTDAHRSVHFATRASWPYEFKPSWPYKGEESVSLSPPKLFLETVRVTDSCFPREEHSRDSTLSYMYDLFFTRKPATRVWHLYVRVTITDTARNHWHQQHLRRTRHSLVAQCASRYVRARQSERALRRSHRLHSVGSARDPTSVSSGRRVDTASTRWTWVSDNKARAYNPLNRHDALPSLGARRVLRSELRGRPTPSDLSTPFQT